MYTIYDIELSKEVLSSLCFLALKCGITFPNKKQFNNIIYKLYNYLKDDFIFNDGIEINEALKNKINEFKNIYNELPNPNLEDSEDFLGTVNSYASTPTFEIMSNIEDAVYDGGGYECPLKFYPAKTGTGYIYYSANFYRDSDGYKITNAVYPVSSPPSTCKYFKVRIIAMTSYYRVYADYYTENDELISSSYQNYSTSYKPTTCSTWNLNHVYGTMTALDVYKLTTYDFSIDGNNLININTDSLNIGDKYYSSEIGFGKDGQEINIYLLFNKKINGEEYGFKYGILETYLNKVCENDKNIFKFITITADEDKTTYTGYVSTYPLYATNVSNELGLWFSSSSSTHTIPVKVFKSIDGVVWKEQTILSGYTYKTEAFEIGTKALSFIGEDIIYSNYPIFYSYTGSNFEEETNNQTRALTEDNLFKLYHNSNEDFTLDRLPPGAGFYFGKHKIEDSPRFKIVFRAIDYTNNINTAYGKQWLPYDAVYCDTAHIIDVLPYNTYKNYNSTEILFGKSPLIRWLNSDAPAGEWWEKTSDYDTPPTEENMYSSSIGYEYMHRAGFLHHFEDVEKELLIDLEIANYEGKKIIFYDQRELPASLNYNYRPKFFKANGNYGTGILEPYCVKELKYHKNTTLAEKCQTELNNFACTNKQINFWTRSKGTNNGQYYYNGYYSYGYNPQGIKPVVCLPKDVKIKREPDKYGIFSLDLPVPETTDIELKFDIERNIKQDIKQEYDTQLNIIEDFTCIFDTTRELAISNIESFDTQRFIQEQCDENYPIYRNVISPIEKHFETTREVNYFYTFKFPTALKTTRDIDTKYPLTRELIEEFSIEEKFDCQRKVNKNNTKKFDIQRDVLGLVNLNFSTLLYIRENIEQIFDTALEIIVHQDFRTPLLRKINENINNIYETERKTCVDREFDFTIERNVYNAEVLKFETTRYIQKEADKEYNLVRYLQKEYIETYDAQRYISEPIIVKFNGQRYITNSSLNKYPIIRSIKKEEAVNLAFNILRDVLEDINFIAKANRFIQQNYSHDNEVCRNIIEDFVVINNNITREVLQNMDENYPTKRFITRDEDKYVSKANLILYTQLLKEQIADYIDLKIAEEFKKRNL